MVLGADDANVFVVASCATAGSVVVSNNAIMTRLNNLAPDEFSADSFFFFSW